MMPNYAFVFPDILSARGRFKRRQLSVVMAYRNLAVLAFMLPAALIAGQWLGLMWFEAFVNGRAFPMPWGWLNVGQLLNWAFIFVFFFALSISFSLMLRTRSVTGWLLALAVIYSLCNLLLGSYWFPSDAVMSDYVWAYGEHLMPLAGAWAATFVAIHMRSRRVASTDT